MCSVLHQLSPGFKEWAAYDRMDKVKDDLNLGRKVVRSFQVCALVGKWSVSTYTAAEQK